MARLVHISPPLFFLNGQFLLSLPPESMVSPLALAVFSYLNTQNGMRFGLIPRGFKVRSLHFNTLGRTSLLFLIENVYIYKVIIKKNKKNQIIRQKLGNNVMLRVKKKIISEQNSHEDLH